MQPLHIKRRVHQKHRRCGKSGLSLLATILQNLARIPVKLWLSVTFYWACTRASCPPPSKQRANTLRANVACCLVCVAHTSCESLSKWIQGSWELTSHGEAGILGVSPPSQAWVTPEWLFVRGIGCANARACGLRPSTCNVKPSGGNHAPSLYLPSFQDLGPTNADALASGDKPAQRCTWQLLSVVLLHHQPHHPTHVMQLGYRELDQDCVVHPPAASPETLRRIPVVPSCRFR
jgi:hypothetical protein